MELYMNVPEHPLKAEPCLNGIMPLGISEKFFVLENIQSVNTKWKPISNLIKENEKQENKGKEIRLSLSIQFYSDMRFVELSVKEQTGKNYPFKD
jgi:hypothetical protein